MGARFPERTDSAASNVVVGYAANAKGFGVAYVSSQPERNAPLLRVPFHVKSGPATFDRETGYAAVTAVIGTLADKRIDAAVIHIEDDSLIEDVRGHREVPPSLTLSYVRLGCALNRLAACRLEKILSEAADLTARARAEVHLTVAA